MIRSDEELGKAQQAIANLERVLMEARKVHSPKEYSAMSEPILLELQQREHEILAYLSEAKAEAGVD